MYNSGGSCFMERYMEMENILEYKLKKSYWKDFLAFRDNPFAVCGSDVSLEWNYLPPQHLKKSMGEYRHNRCNSR